MKRTTLWLYWINIVAGCIFIPFQILDTSDSTADRVLFPLAALVLMARYAFLIRRSKLESDDSRVDGIST